MVYNEELCKTLHKSQREEMDRMWDKLKSIEGRFWAIIILLLMNLTGIIATFIAKG